MSDYVCFLVTVFYRAAESTLECALKVHRDQISEDCILYYMEPENKAFLWNLLPSHVREAGPVIKVQELFEIHDVSDR